jgi:hypothetical protein
LADERVTPDVFEIAQQAKTPHKWKKENNPVRLSLIFSTSFFLPVINRLVSKAHVNNLARLQLPIPALQDPDIFAAEEDAPSLGRIFESVFNPVRVGDAGNQISLVLAIPTKRRT